jgi:hypothetical protein
MVVVGAQWDKETTELVIGWFGSKKHLMVFFKVLGQQVYN